MNEHTSIVLEFQALLSYIGGYSQTALGRHRIEDLKPAVALVEITADRELYANLIGVLADGGSLPGIQFEGLSDMLHRLGPEGAVVSGDELLQCRGLLDAVDAVQIFLASYLCRKRSALQRLGARLDPCETLRNALRKSIDDDGTVLDSASEKLRDVRASIRDLEKRIQRSLDRMLKQKDLESVVQEQFVTTRNGRFVIPIRRSEKNAFPGIIHDHSNSGQTLFVEPARTVGMGNDLADAKLEERDEVYRVLARISGLVRTCTGALRADEKSLTDLDAACAVARWSHSHQCILPTFGDDLRLKRARHPLLQKQLREDGRDADLVPLDLQLPKHTRILVITGSNTGGKTVALKTVGLLSLAAQAGLPVPVDEGSEFEVFDHVFADIGDEQSLQESLSTFSAHVSNITDILRQAKHGRSLILLDELGSGTDPVEGGALACAFLVELCTRDALTMATTHLGAVKTFVHDRNGMVNAAVRFNVENLEPEYVLDVGRPGASHALLIAERLKVPVNVVETAKRLLSKDQLRLETVLAKMEEDQRRLADREGAAKGAEEELLRDRDELKEELKELRKERRQLMNEAYREAAGIVENTRKQMERQLRDLRDETAGHSGMAKPLLKTARTRIADKGHQLAQGLEQTEPRAENPVDVGRLRAGDLVWIPKVNSDGTIVTFSHDRRKVTVDVDGLPFTLKSDTLGRPHGEKLPRQKKPVEVKVSRPRSSGPTSHELNLIGEHVDEAIQHLERFIDRAVLAKLSEVRIVHGFGSGRLRTAVGEWLSSSQLVRKHRLGVHSEDPGGGGATIVTLVR